MTLTKRDLVETLHESGIKNIAPVLASVFISPNEVDRNLEDANVVDGLFAISRSIRALADAIDRAFSPVTKEDEDGR